MKPARHHTPNRLYVIAANKGRGLISLANQIIFW